ncbi:hypothetical protein SeMB42_g07403 [Synchytrium endobioticum]|uniref:PRELI/MSF1 domain-containing protein n=1 Tax=Synchytrium endobioticum TaxID=286115 RepID=A0A507C4C9_9FUNG|nr:hypothetical protein SeMB42_g07403 [Synchytrium endobioticum]TPX41044.1 hypothetical protein SeLEV6574_g06280 [Synchytrium endobioticum]
MIEHPKGLAQEEAILRYTVRSKKPSLYHTTIETSSWRTEGNLQNVPWILKKLGIQLPEVTYFREISELDLRRECYTARSVNLSLRNLVTMEETCVLRPSKLAPLTSTEFTQSATITALGGISSIAKLVEEQAVNRFKSNADVGRRGLEQVLDKVAAELTDAARKADSFADEFMEGFAKERARSTSSDRGAAAM